MHADAVLGLVGALIVITEATCVGKDNNGIHVSVLLSTLATHGRNLTGTVIPTSFFHSCFPCKCSSPACTYLSPIPFAAHG